MPLKNLKILIFFFFSSGIIKKRFISLTCTCILSFSFFYSLILWVDWISEDAVGTFDVDLVRVRSTAQRMNSVSPSAFARRPINAPSSSTGRQADEMSYTDITVFPLAEEVTAEAPGPEMGWWIQVGGAGDASAINVPLPFRCNKKSKVRMKSGGRCRKDARDATARAVGIFTGRFRFAVIGFLPHFHKYQNTIALTFDMTRADNLKNITWTFLRT